MGRNRKRHWKTIGIVTVFVIILSGSLWYFWDLRTNSTEKHPNDRDMTIENDIVTATGITGVGMDTVCLAIDFLENTSLRVEEVYCSKGDTVAKGKKCLKFTNDSINQARAELERVAQKAELAYRSGVISDGESRMQAKYTYDMAVIESDFAEQVYQDILAQLTVQLDKAIKAYNAAGDAYNVYNLAVENNTFYEDYQIEELKKAYDDAYDLFVSRREYFEVTQDEIDALADGGINARVVQGDRQWAIRTVALLKEEMAEAKLEYEQTRQAYQREIEGAGVKLLKLLNDFEQAQQDLTDAQIEMQKGSLHAKTVYELAVAKGQTAEGIYNAQLVSLGDTLERLKDAKDNAARNKAIFEELVGDGYLYTDRSGTILMINAEVGQSLARDDLLLAYVNPKKMSVTVTVPEMDAAKLFVGERANVMVADCGSFDGIVEAIQPLASPDGKASVYNTVVVSFGGNVSAVSSGLTTTVVFGEMAQVGENSDEATDHQMISQMYEFDVFTGTDKEQVQCLQVEEVYVETGQYIEEGDPVCRFTQDSIEAVRKELTYAQSKACVALVEAQTDYHINVLEAGLTHNEAVEGQKLAEITYDNTIARLNSDLVAKFLETEQLLADIYQLQLSLTEDAYLKQKADITRAYDNAKKQVENARESFVTNQIEAAQSFQEAKKAYDTFFEQFEMSNQQIAEKVEEVYRIQDEILQSQQFMEKELLAAEQTRSQSQLDAEIAYAKYIDSLKKYEKAVNQAQSDLDQAAQKLDEFNQFIGDGTICALEDGWVIEVDCLSLSTDETVLVDTEKKDDVQLTETVVTSPKVIAQTFDLDIAVLMGDSDVALQVEEVLVSAGQQVEKGTALFHVTPDSVSNVRTILQRQVLETNKNYELLKATQKELRLQALQQYENYSIDGKYADTIFHKKCSNLQQQADDAKEAVDYKQEQVNENMLELTQAQQELAKAQKYLKEAKAAVAENYNNRYNNAYYYTVYENTREKAQSMVEQLEEKMEILTEKNESLLYAVEDESRNYHQIVQDLEKEKLAAKLEYDIQVYDSKMASEWYDIQIAGLDNDLQEARERYESSLQNIRNFDACIVQNKVLSAYEGILEDVLIEAGDYVGIGDRLVLILE